MAIDNYRGGYFKALLDVRNIFENDAFWIGVRSVRKARKQMSSYLKMTLENPLALDEMIEKGFVVCRISPDGECKAEKG